MKKKKNISDKKRVLKNSLYEKNHLKESIETIKYWNKLVKINSYFTKHSFEGKGIKNLLTFLDKLYDGKKKDYIPFKLMANKHCIKIYSRLILEGIIDPPVKGKVNIINFFKGEYKSKINYFKLISDRKKLEIFKKRRGNRKQYQIVKEKLMIAYKTFVLNEKRVRYSNIQKDQFHLAAKRLVRYMIGNKRLDYLDHKNGASIDDFIRVLITSLKKHYKNKGFGIGHLCSNYTFNEILPKYINLNKPK